MLEGFGFVVEVVEEEGDFGIGGTVEAEGEIWLRFGAMAMGVSLGEGFLGAGLFHGRGIFLGSLVI